MRAADISGASFHTVRHTVGSWLGQRGFFEAQVAGSLVPQPDIGSVTRIWQISWGQSASRSTMSSMSIDELESEAMKLDPKARARLAGKLLESFENLSEEESPLSAPSVAG
jgi:hypothetical protein